MSSQIRIDPTAVRSIGAVFGETARSIDVACTGLGECDFGSQLGRRHEHHEVAYSAGLSALAQSVTMLAQSARKFGDGLVGAADTLDEQDTTNAGALGDGKAGRG